MQEHGQEWPLPEIDDGMHIIRALMSAGPMQAGGMGPAALSWQEIESWHSSTSSPLKPHELELLRDLSHEYLDQWIKSKDRGCPSPEVIRPDGERAKRLDDHIRSVLRG